MKNNNEQFENFIRDFDSIRMTNDEKNEMYENLEFFTCNYISKPSPYFSHISFFKKTIAVTLILLLTISISRPASAKSLPGELLYNIKIIHEKIEAATITKPEKKIDFEIKQTETRIREAVTLAKCEKLNTIKQEKLAKDIKKHVKNVSDKIEVIKTENPEKALALNSDLKTTLKVNSKALEKAIEKSKTIEKADGNTKKLTDEDKENEIISQEEKDINLKDINPVDKKNEKNTEINSQDNENILSQENIILDLNKEDIEKNEEIESNNKELFANIILNSIEEDIEKTEIINDDIENEIIAEENKNELELQQQIENSNETTGEKSLNHIIINLEEASDKIYEKEINNKLVPIINQKQKTIEENLIDGIKNDEILDLNIIQPIINENKILTNLEISDDLRLEITSLENVLEAEERLKLLLTELLQKRENEKIELIKKLIEDKKLGQAYIEIQKEIEFLTEIKLSRELGINEEIPKTINDEKTQI